MRARRAPYDLPSPSYAHFTAELIEISSKNRPVLPSAARSKKLSETICPKPRPCMLPYTLCLYLELEENQNGIPRLPPALPRYRYSGTFDNSPLNHLTFQAP